jgi:hypothetical protein
MQQLGTQMQYVWPLNCISIKFLYKEGKKKLVKCISSYTTNGPLGFSNVLKLVPWFLKVKINGTLILVHLP